MLTSAATAELRAQGLMAAVSAATYLLASTLNVWLFTGLQFTNGIHWIYLPAGVQLLCVLLFAEAGAIGIVAGSFAAGYYQYFPGDAARALGAGLLTGLSPYLVYRLAHRRYGLQQSLADLTAARLLVLAVGCSLLSPLLAHAWFAWTGLSVGLSSLVAMFIGDLLGTLLVLYGLRFFLLMLPRPQA